MARSAHPSAQRGGEIVIAAIGRGAIWLGNVTTFNQLTARVICQELQETIDAARALHGD